MAKMKQKEAVLKAIGSVLAENNRSISDGEKVELSKDERAKVIDIIFTGFKNEEIELSVEYPESDLKAYTSSLLNNWLRKAKELNGGNRYVAKNPGSRAGQQDEMLKNLRLLLKAKQAAQAPKEQLEQIQVAIDQRLAEVRASKVKTPEIDISALPEKLRHLVGESASA